MKTCSKCENYIASTGECCVVLNAIANDAEIPQSVSDAMDKNSKDYNECCFFK